MTGQSSPSPDTGTTGLAAAIEAEFERVYQQAGFGYMPAPSETARVCLTWLADQREQIARTLGDLNVDGWIVVPDRNTGEPMQEQVPLDYIADAVLALLAGLAAGQGTT